MLVVMETTTALATPVSIVPPSTQVQPLSLQIIVGVLAGSLALVTLLGNFSVIFAFVRTRRLHTYANFYIISLATADLISGIAFTPLHGVYWLLGYWPFGDTVCFIYNMIGTSTFHTTYLATLVIALDRYFSIAYPLKHLNYRTTKVAMSVIFLIYAVPVIVWWPFFIYWRFGYNGNFLVPPYRCIPKYLSNIYVTVAVICLQTWIPILVMVILYVSVYRIARVAKTNKRLNAIRESESEATSSRTGTNFTAVEIDNQSAARVNPVFTQEDESPCDDIDQSQKVQSPKCGASSRTAKPKSETGCGDIEIDIKRASTKNRKKGNKALRTLTPIFIAMMVSGLPWAIAAIIFVFCQTCLPRIITVTAIFLARTYGGMNPFCYAIANPLYRQAFLRVVCSKEKKPGP